MAERSIDRRRILILILDILVVLSVAYAVLGMVFAKDNSALVTGGRGAFKYYTVLSNVFCALTSLVCVIFMLARKDRSLPVPLYLLHLAGSCVVSVTLIVVIIFLGPTMGFGNMFVGVCFWLHLFAPVLSIISQMLLRPQKEIRLRSTVFAVVPTILYGAVYIIVNAVNWTGKSNPVTDMYGFLRWGWSIGAMLLVAICLINWLVAVLFRKCAGKGKTN